MFHYQPKPLELCFLNSNQKFLKTSTWTVLVYITQSSDWKHMESEDTAKENSRVLVADLAWDLWSALLPFLITGNRTDFCPTPNSQCADRKELRGLLVPPLPPHLTAEGQANGSWVTHLPIF